QLPCHLAQGFSDFGVSGVYNWTGDFQIGWEQSIGDHFSYDAAFDARFFGNTAGPILPGSGIPISVTTHHNSDFRVQLFANWAWSRALTTAIGYQAKAFSRATTGSTTRSLAGTQI